MKCAALLLTAVLLFPVFISCFELNSANSQIWIVDSATGSRTVIVEAVGAAFTVDVIVADVADLYNWQIALEFNNTLLNATDASIPENSVFSGKSYYAPPPTIDNTTTAGLGFVLCGASLRSEPSGVNVTKGFLCQIHFSALAEGSSELRIATESEPVYPRDSIITWESFIEDSGGDEILFSAVDGGVVVSVLPRGPRMNNLYIKYYDNSSLLFDALMNGQVDLSDLDLTDAQIERLFNESSVQAAVSPAFVIFQLDFNNNETISTYPYSRSPTAYKAFRQGIASLVNKTYIVNEVCSYSHRIDTPIPRPNGDWWVDESVSQYDSYGDILGNYPYEYSPDLAAYYFNISGFVEGDVETGTPNPWYDPSFPSSAQYLRQHPETGEDLEPLVFYIRNDDPRRLEVGRILRDNLRKLGIPVNATESDRITCIIRVMLDGDYHIYTGGWSSADAMEYLLIYRSESITEEVMVNYVQFRNSTYDEWAEKVLHPSNLTTAREAARICQSILVEEAASVWLWSPSRVMGYGNLYGVVNLRGGQVDNRWTFLNARVSDNFTRTMIRYGLRSPPTSLNIATDYTPRTFWSAWPASEERCLDRIYDTLLSYNPYEKTPGRLGRTMPWMAEEWEIQSWESPYEPTKNLTKLVFYLRDGVKWHDGVELNSSDVKFTIEYIQGLGNLSSLYTAVADVHHVTTPSNRMVVVYENVSDIWTLDTIGTLPIMPQHIFQNIANVTGYTPGEFEGHLANETLVGSGPWKYVFHNSSMLYLEANRDHFMETPTEAEIDFRYDWEMGSWVVDAMDATMVGEAFGTSGNGEPDAKWEPGSDMNGDCTVDIFDAVTLAQQFNATWGKSAARVEVIPPPFLDEAVYVEAFENPVLVGENLTVYVNLANLSKLSGIQFKLKYDNTKLDCQSLNVSQIFGSYTSETKKEINQTMGFVWVSIMSLGSTQQFSGNTTLATIVFNATKPGGSMLDLRQTKLARYGASGSTCQLMPHKALSRQVVVGVSTPTGSNVTVIPEENTRVTFTETTTAGVTTLGSTLSPSPNFADVLCDDLDTTATYTGPIFLEFPYEPMPSAQDEEAMKVWRWNETSMVWVDETTTVDTENNIVYAVTPSLSIFTVHNILDVEGNMSQEGEITVGFPAVPPEPPEGFVAVNYYDIQTTKEYTPPLVIRLAYSEGAVPPEEEIFLRMCRWNETSMVWVDETTTVDTENNIVYAVTPSLSIFTVHSIAPLPQAITVVNGTCSKTVVGQGYNVTIDSTVENQGDFTETFDVVVYGNLTTLATYPVTLSPADQIVISYEWDTTGWTKGNYTVSTGTHLVNSVVVTIPGDINGDRKVDMRDIGIAARAFGAKPGDSNWNPDADINNDGKVDMRDIGIAARSFGEEWP